MPAEASAASVASLTAGLVGRSIIGFDVHAERWWDALVRAAHRDRAGTLATFAGVGSTTNGVAFETRLAGRVARGEAWTTPHWVAHGPGGLRGEGVVRRLGDLPFLLSTPSTQDLLIRPVDLLERLREYASAGVAAERADLALAALRVDPSAVGAAELEDLRSVRVPVHQEGKRWRGSAGALVADYLTDPLVEPRLVAPQGARKEWMRTPVFATDAAVALGLCSSEPPHEFTRRWEPSELPLWGESRAARQSLYEDTLAGVAWAQLVKRSSPLGPAVSTALARCLRDISEPHVGEVGVAAVRAWERGLLLPGVADPALLNFRGGGLNRLGGLVRGLLPVVEAGGGRVAWELADALLLAGATAARVQATADEVATLVERMTPAAVAAVGSGVAPERVLAMPGLRALAGRGGSSAAVRTARRVVENLGPRAGTVAAEATGARADLDSPDRADVLSRPTPQGSATSGRRERAKVQLPPAAPVVELLPPADVPDVPDGVAVRLVAPERARASPLRSARLLFVLPGGGEYAASTGWWQYDHPVTAVDSRCWTVPPGPAHPHGESEVRVLVWDPPLGAVVPLDDVEWQTRRANTPGLEPQRLRALPRRVGLMGRLFSREQPRRVEVPGTLWRGMVTATLALAAWPSVGVGDARLMALVDAGRLSPTSLRPAAVEAIQALTASGSGDPGPWARLVAQRPELLATTWPLLQESLRHGALEAKAAEGVVPRWLHGVLDVVANLRATLAAGFAAGLLSLDASPLEELAALPGGSTAVAKAAALREEWSALLRPTQGIPSSSAQMTGWRNTND